MSLTQNAIVWKNGVPNTIRTPDAGLSLTYEGWGEATGLLNGSAGTIASDYAGRRLTLNWTAIPTEEINSLSRLFAFAGDSTFYYQDATILNAENVLSPLLGLPYLLLDTWSPAAVDNNGITLAQREGDTGIRFKAVQATDGLEHRYSEVLPVPEGYQALVRAVGENVNRAVTINSIAAGSTPVRLNGGRAYEVVVKHSGSDSMVSHVKAALVPTGGDAPSWITDDSVRHPAGYTSMRIIPQSFAITHINAAYKVGSASVDLVEVWPWL